MSIYVSLIDGMGSATDSVGGSVTTTGANTGDFMGFASDLLVSAGVRNGFGVTENSPADMSVNVGAGTCYVENSSWAANSVDTRFWRVVSTATENVSIDSNSSGNDRIDLICVKVDVATTPNSDASNVASVVVVKGTPAASPVAPSVPSNHLKLAEVYVADGATSITNSNITSSIVAPIMWAELLRKKYSFRAKLSTGQSIPDATNTTVQFDTEEYDTWGVYNASSYKFVAPVDGIYNFTAKVAYTSVAADKRVLIYIDVDGTPMIYGQDMYTGGTSVARREIIAVGDVKLDSGDEVKVYTYQNTGGAEDLSTVIGRSFFSGHLVEILP